ncbi:MAG: hypothetical protein EAZ42_04385 [Verrucomicrobia bacterium]|nr:MAG: hypothetical protein EAZ42_04385 [Verrucomicrobiota bacterium]
MGDRIFRALIREPFCVNSSVDVENNPHRAATNLAIVVQFRRQFIIRRHGDLEALKACRACDSGKVHESSLHAAREIQVSILRGLASHQKTRQHHD